MKVKFKHGGQALYKVLEATETMYRLELLDWVEKFLLIEIIEREEVTT